MSKDERQVDLAYLVLSSCVGYDSISLLRGICQDVDLMDGTLKVGVRRNKWHVER